ncbi:solute carrier family 23 protein, partial [Escherichia coli]|uniref:solute carrier family 23 protein n=1 Tax=Escherichia coli TaxID=562 RepID=UPI0024E0F659
FFFFSFFCFSLSVVCVFGSILLLSVNFSVFSFVLVRGMGRKSVCFYEVLLVSSLLSVSCVGAFLVVCSSLILPYLRRVITPTVRGIVVLMIGLSLIKVGIIDFGGGFAAKSSGTFGNYE